MATKKNGAGLGATAPKSSDKPRNAPIRSDATRRSTNIASGDRVVSDRVAMRAALTHALDRGLDAHWLVPAVRGQKGTGKQPAHPYIERLVHTPADVPRLWQQHQPAYGLGMRTGRNGIGVVEVDWPADPAARERVQQELTRLLSPDSSTLPPPTVRSGGGGEHWHIRFVEDVPPPSGCVLWRGAGAHEEIRLIGVGGNAALPPTLHWSGNEYTWGDGDMLRATPALIEAAARRTHADPTDDEAAALTAEQFDLAAVSDELRQQLEHAGTSRDRSAGVYRAVCLLRERGYAPAHALWLVTESGLPFCSRAAERGPHATAKDVLRSWRKATDKKHAEAAADFSQEPVARKKHGRFVLTKASDLMADLPDRTYDTALGTACPVGVVMIAGLGGTGKSTIAATFAAHVSNGTPCPPWEGKTTKRAPAGVLWLTTEEDRDRIVLPRHEALDGDMDLLFVPTVETALDADGRPRALNFDLEQDLEPLLEQAQQAGTPIRLVVCDTLPSLINWDGRNTNSDTDVKALLADLHKLALKFDCCVLGISHLNKKADAADEYRMAGSQAWREHPRVSFLCKAGYIYVNKTNDMSEVGCGYQQRVARVLYEIDAITESGGPMQVTARRAEFGPVLLDKAKVMELVDLATTAAKHEEREAKPKRIDRMVEIASEYFDLLGGRMRASILWREIEREYGSAPNSTEKQEIGQRLRLRAVRDGVHHYLERRAA